MLRHPCATRSYASTGFEVDSTCEAQRSPRPLLTPATSTWFSSTSKARPASMTQSASVPTIKTAQHGQLVAFVCNWRVAIHTDCPDEILRTEFDHRSLRRRRQKNPQRQLASLCSSTIQPIAHPERSRSRHFATDAVEGPPDEVRLAQPSAGSRDDLRVYFTSGPSSALTDPPAQVAGSPPAHAPSTACCCRCVRYATSAS